VPDDATTGGPEGRKQRQSEGRNPRLRFPKAARLIRTAEFARVRMEGRPVHGKMITLGVLKGASDADGRVGIVTSKRVGGAVVRNLVRRRLREVFRAMRPRLIPGVWLVVVAKSSAAKATFAVLAEECSQLAQRGRILRDITP
jgi:ribonuclease P protein component